MTNFPRFNSIEDQLKRMADRLKALEMRPSGASSNADGIGAATLLRRTSTFTVSQGTWTGFTPQVSQEDLRGVMTRIQGTVTIQQEGSFLISCAAEFLARSGDGDLGVRALVNGSSDYPWYAVAISNRKGFPGGSITIPLSVGDTVTMQVNHWRGSGNNTINWPGTYFNIVYLG